MAAAQLPPTHNGGAPLPTPIPKGFAKEATGPVEVLLPASSQKGSPTASPKKNKKKGSLARLCLVGVGYMGKFRLKLMEELPRTQCVAVVEPCTENPVWQNTSLIPVYPTLEQVIQAHNIDGIWISAPTSEHSSLIKHAVELGVKHIYCERPIASSEQEIWACYDLCEANSVLLNCGWYRRFDDSYIHLYESVSLGTISSAHFVSRDKRALPATGPLPGTGIFYDVMYDDFNLALLFMNEQLPISLQATARDTFGVGSCDNAFCTLEYTGRTVFLEAYRFGPYLEHGIRLVSNGTIIEQGKDHPASDFFTRYEAAFRSEVEFFARLCCGERWRRRCVRDSCIATAQLASLAENSSKLGRRLPFNPGPVMQLVQVGDGKFGSHVQRLLASISECHTVEVLNQSNADQLESVLASPNVTSVYVCTPYHLHSEIVERCLLAGKRKILCEPPLLELAKLQEMAVSKDALLMLGFQRRFARKFMKAKDLLSQLLDDNMQLESLTVESRELGLANEDVINVIYCSVVHDFDLVSWLFEDIDCEVSVKDVQIHGQTNLTITLNVWLPRFDQAIESQILYSRGPTCIQHIFINGKQFGYTSTDTCHYNVYNDALQRQFKFFASQPGNIPGQGKFCLSYTRTHTLLNEVVEKVDDEDDDALDSHMRKIGEMSFATLQAFERGVAGHGGMYVVGNRVLKPLMYEDIEWKMYQLAKEKLPELAAFLPLVFEKVRLKGVSYMVLQDLTYGYQNPKVFDLKVGEPSDFGRMHSQPYAFKVAGFTGGDVPRRAQQSWNDVVGFFKDYLRNWDNSGTPRYELIPEFVNRIQEILLLFKRQTTFRMRAASLLFVWDCVEIGTLQPSVHITDLARTKESKTGEVDHFFCFGLENAITMLRQIHAKFVNRHGVLLCCHEELKDGDGNFQEAQELVSRLRHENINIIVCSPDPNVVSTAKAMAQQLNIPFEIEPAMGQILSFFSPGRAEDSWERFDDDELADTQQEDRSGSDLESEAVTTGLETWEVLQKRVHDALMKVCSFHKRVVILSHKGTFEALLSFLLGTGKYYSPTMQDRSITLLLPANNRTGWTIDRLNSLTHLSSSNDSIVTGDISLERS